jgi:glycosyltransferase involved in cell wall biosynthesis
MTTKTIWFLSKYYASPPSEGSGSVRIFLLMREISRMNHHSVIFTSSSDPYSELDAITSKTEFRVVDGVKIWLLRGLNYKSSISISRIFSWLYYEYVLFQDHKKEQSRPDLIVVSSPSILTIFNGLYFKRKFKAKLVFEVRDIWPLTLVEDVGMRRWNPFILLMGLIEKMAYKYSDGIVGTMPNLQKHVKNILGFAKPVGFAPMGISEENFKVATPLDDTYIQAHIPKDKFLIVYAGTIGIANALETLFDCASLINKDTDVHFLIVGDGAMLSFYKQKYSHLTNLTFAPKIKKSQVQSLLGHADLLYFSVANSEVWDYGQSLNKIIDYMISAKPIIASYSGYPSMIDESGCGVFVPAGNAVLLAEEIDRMRNIPSAQLTEMGLKGKQWLMENRNYKTLAKNFINYFSKI